MHLIRENNIRFPNLGIIFENLPSGINVFDVKMFFYGMIIGIGMIAGILIAEKMAKQTGQDTEIYMDFALPAILFSVLCARIYYVIFSFDEFKYNPMQILNPRTGGLAIYGGIIGAIVIAIVYSKVKKYPFWLFADTGCVGLITGQIIGRWGNFFNREAFGKYADGLFAMQLDLRDVSYDYRMSIPRLQEKYAGKEAAFNRIMEIRNNIHIVDGVEYIQVHPTFLYESLWNFAVLILLIVYTKHKKFDGEIILLYLAGYGLGRVWIEGLRTDQLFLWGTPIAVSQLLSAILVILSIIILIYKRRKAKEEK